MISKDWLDIDEDIFSLQPKRKLRIYVAGRFDPEPIKRLRLERDKLRAAGHEVVSTWLDEECAAPTQAGLAGTYESEAMYAEYAQRDFDQIIDADLLICDTLDDNPRAGREVEFGIALASRAQAWVVGLKRNVFHRIVPFFETWDEVHAALAKGDA